MNTKIFCEKKGSILKNSLMAVLLSVLTIACVPSEETLTQKEVDGIQTFDGVSNVETISASQLKVTWKKSEREIVVGYSIYDSTLSTQPKLVKTVNNKETTSAIISGLSEGFLYRYRVKTLTENGSEDNNEVDIHGIPYGGATSVNVVSSTSVELNYASALSTEVLELNVYCKQAGQDYERVSNVRNLNSTKYVLTDLLPNLDYTCKVNSVVDGNEDNNTSELTFKALGRADRVAFVTQPGNGNSGELLSLMPVVHILDENNNIVSGGPDAEAFVTLTVSVTSPTTGTVRGTATVSAIAGVANFSDLFVQEAGIKVLTATKSDTSSAPGGFGTSSMTVESNSFNITSSTISPLLTTIEVENSSNLGVTPVANGTDAYVVTFRLKDEFGNPVSGIIPQFSSNMPGDFLSQPLSPSDVDGVTTAVLSTNVSDTNTSSVRTLSVSSPAGLDSIQVLAPFNPGAANQLAFNLQPTSSPAGDFGMNELSVSIQDNFGNTITSGASSSQNISLSISNNVGGAVLSGTTSLTSVNGVATFTDLGIDITATGYRLIAASGVLTPVQSNNFNINAGIPRVIGLSGVESVLSGECSGLIVLQLQDFGGNPSRAITNTTIQLSGLSNSDLYTSASCGGTSVGTSITFTPGTDTRNLYLRNPKVEAVNLVATDSSNVMTQGSHLVNVSASLIRLDVASNPINVVSGQCSSALEIVPLASDLTVGRVFSPTNVQLLGITGSQAKVYSDASCLNELDESSIALSQLASPNEKTLIYLKNPRGEELNVNVVDPNGNLGTVSTPRTVKFLPSTIDFDGPTTVVAGTCSSVFTITLQDTEGNNATVSGNTTISINGMSGSPSGQFYTSPTCSGGGSNSTLTVPDDSSLFTVYYRGLDAEVLNLSISDPSGDMTTSQTIVLEVSPSSLLIVKPAGVAESDTSVCTDRFRVRLRDGANNNSNAVSPITVNLSGQGTSAKFYSDVDCSTEISSLNFGNGEGVKDFYFKGHYPETGLTLLAEDSASVLTADTQSWVVNSQLSWLGSAGEKFTSGSVLIPFRVGLDKPMAARVNGLREPWHMAMDPTKQYLYVVDRADHRVLKYDYSNMELVGWMGRLRQEGGLSVTGSNLATPSTAACVTTTNYSVLPGWCLGGGSIAQLDTTGGLYSPRSLTVDDTFVYVVNESSQTVNRYNADTGAFDGWIGTKNNTNPSGPGTNGPPSCNVANGAAIPGWCIGGNRTGPSAFYGDGRIRQPRSTSHDSVYLYVGTAAQVLRFDKATGSFQGWIGRVNQTPDSGAPGCTLSNDNDQTPGWCYGGRGETGDARSGTGNISTAADVVVDEPNDHLYVLSSASGGVINKYSLSTGAFIEKINSVYNLTDPQQMFISGGKFYIAADERIVRMDSTGTIDGWMGKVANNAGLTGGAGCNSLSPNDNTPGWCLGGSQKSGLDETAFINQYGIVDDGTGSLLTISRYRPIVKKFDISSGTYQGSMGMESKAPSEWSGDLSVVAQQESSDDNGFYFPGKPLVLGDFLFVADRNNSRIKKLNKRTGELVGWIGGVTTVPTGGQDQSACTNGNAMSPSPSYCTGALPYPSYTWNDQGMIDDTANGIMQQPQGLATDGTWLYVTDYAMHRIQKFHATTGAYGGWIGRVNQSPTAGDPGCTGTPNNSVTPGWCLGGTSEYGTSTGDGAMRNPGGITYFAGSLYVTDRYYHRVLKYNAITGSFEGWIGRVSGSPTGCTPISNGGYNVSGSGWCIGGTSSSSVDYADRGGAFRFDYGSHIPDIYTDNQFLYITNTRNSRLDKFSFAGEFIEATRTRSDSYADGWKSSQTDVAAIGNSTRHRDMPQGIYMDGTYIYVATAVPNQRRNEPMGIVKIDKATGLVIGWKGAIDPDNGPTGGDPGCIGATVITPGWCTGGRINAGVLAGQTSGYYGTLTGDDHFLYISDRAGHRITRIPK